MATNLPFACRCGQLHGILHDAAPTTGCHLVCYCADCQAAARHFGVADQLEPGGGTPLFQVLPSRIQITGGGEHVACMRLSPKGLHRWYAACCDTPLATTIGTPRMPLAGMWRPLFADPAPLGPVAARVFTRFAGPDGPKKDRGHLRVIGSLLRRSLTAWLAGTARKSPFFDAGGRPIATPKILTLAERRALTR